MKPVDHFDLAEQTIERAADLYQKNGPIDHVNMWVRIAGVHAQLAQVQQSQILWTGEIAS
jgi:hypothetical protein